MHLLARLQRATKDPEEDDLYYYIVWGDGHIENWIGPYESGEEIKVQHNWTAKGTYTIRIKAKDSEESDWSDPLSVSMSKNKMLSNMILYFYFEKYPLIMMLVEKIF